MSELPIGWAETTLGNTLLSVIGGGTPSRKVPAYFDGHIPWFTVKDMKALKPNDAEEHISEDAIVESATNLIPANTLIVATRIALGKAIRPTVACAINQDLKALILGSGINADFLLYWIGANQRMIQELGSGTTVLGIRLEALHGLPFHLPPSAEQTRIVAKLEELLSDLDAGVAELKVAQKKLAQYRQSLLKAAVEGDDSGASFPKLTLGELVTSIGQGWSPKCKPEAATNDEQWAVMKTTAIQSLDFDGVHNKLLPSDLKPRQHLELKSGDLLVTRAGPRNRVGISCLVRSTRPKLILCDKAYRIKCDETLINPEFLELVLNAPHIVQRIDELKTGISDSGLNLTQDRFFTLE
ncbi:MAG TPA: restriction endonuclease subunit S, partial [Cellvibrio sp.]